MDTDNKPITNNTLLTKLPFEKTKLLEVIDLGKLDDRALNDAMKKVADDADLDKSSDFGSLSKQIKLGHILNNDKITLLNIAELHKDGAKEIFKKMLLMMVIAIANVKASDKFSAHVGSVAAFGTTLPTGSSSPISSSTTTSASITANERLATTLDRITESQVQLVAMMKTMNDNMVNTVSANSYAKVPNSDPPSFSNERKNCLSLKRFFENKFKRWMLENKLKDSDAFVYLHKIFSNRTDQERAYKIIQNNKATGIDAVLSGLSQFFRLNEIEILELQNKFYGFKLDNSSNLEEAFNRLYELQASIQADAFVESTAINLVKLQFNKCVQDLTSTSSNTLRPIFISQKWIELNTLDDILRLLRQVVPNSGKNRNGNNKNDKETLNRSESSVSTNATTPHPDDMDVSAISSSRSSKRKGKKGSHKSSNNDKEKGKSKFKDCPKSGCTGKNIYFADFCNKCGLKLKGQTVASISSSSTSKITEDAADESKSQEDLYRSCVSLANIEENYADVEVSTKQTAQVHTLDRSRRNLPVIELKFFNETMTKNSRAYKSLFDTGAYLNYIQEDTFNIMKKRYNLILYKCNYMHNTATGDPLGILGYTILPVLKVWDSFGNEFLLKQIPFRVAPRLSHQIIVGRTLQELTCSSPDHGFLLIPNPMRVLLNVNMKGLKLNTSTIGTKLPSETINFCDFKSDGLAKHALEPDDVMVSAVDPLTSKIINIGTPDEPIFTSSERSSWFKNKLKNLIHTYRQCTSTIYKPFKMDPVRIEMTGEIPSKQRFIPLQPERKKILKAKVEKMVHNGILKWTTEAANSCLMLTAKNNGIDSSDEKAWRVINDLVNVNKYVKECDYHLPPIMDLLNQCEGYSLFAKVDVPDAYHCVPIKPDQAIIAMVPGCNQNVEFIKLAQGLKPASGIFCKTLDQFFISMEAILKYLDDLLIKAKAEAELISNLQEFFEICKEFDIRISLRKSQFGVGTLEFLSYKIHNGRIGISDSHRKAIEAIKGKDLAPDSLAGFLGYFSHYICDKDLMHLLRSPEDWSDEKELALSKLKEKILNAPMRTLVNFKNELKIYVDASDTGFSTALFQVDDTTKNMEVVSLYSKNMVEDRSWSNKNIYQRELLALATAVNKYEYMLRGSHKVTIYTDNQAVSQSKKSRAFVIRNLFDRLESDFNNVTVKFCPSSKNSVADILSRGKVEKIDEVDIISKIPTDICQVTTRRQLKQLSIPGKNLENDETLVDKKAEDLSPELEKFLKRTMIFHVRGGHPSAERIYDLYKKMFAKEFPGLTLNRLRKEISRCSCPIRKRDSANFIPRYASTNRELFLDFKEVGTSRCQLSSKRKMYRLSIIEPLSGAIFSVPHNVTSGESVVDSISLVLQVHGRVDCLRTDNAPEFVKGPLKIFGDNNSIKIRPSSVYNPTANLSERHHSNINKIINLADKPTFQEANQIIFDFTTSHNSLPSKHGFSPYEVLKGQLPVECLPVELGMDLDTPSKQKLTASQIVENVWQSRCKNIIEKLPINEKAVPFKEGQRVSWNLKLPTGGLKLFTGTIHGLNPSSVLLKLDHSGNFRWLAMHHIRPLADPNLLAEL